MEEHRFKRLTVDNWQEPDPVFSHFVRYSLQDGSIQSIGSDEWAQAILAVELSDRVPLEVHRLFAVARGALVYGFFFYPLYTLGAEQLFRVAEAAIGHKCRELGVPETQLKDLNFKDQIIRLVKEGAIPLSDEERWNDLRELRKNRCRTQETNRSFRLELPLAFFGAFQRKLRGYSPVPSSWVEILAILGILQYGR